MKLVKPKYLQRGIVWDDTTPSWLARLINRIRRFCEKRISGG